MAGIGLFAAARESNEVIAMNGIYNSDDLRQEEQTHLFLGLDPGKARIIQLWPRSSTGVPGKWCEIG